MYLVDVILVFKITKCIIYVALILIKCTVLGIIIIYNVIVNNDDDKNSLMNKY